MEKDPKGWFTVHTPYVRNPEKIAYSLAIYETRIQRNFAKGRIAILSPLKSTPSREGISDCILYVVSWAHSGQLPK